MTTTRRVFVSAVPSLAIGGVAWAQERQRPVTSDPLADAVAQELIQAMQTLPSMATLKLATNLLATLAESTGLARRIDLLVQSPRMEALVFGTLNDDHAAHQAERAKALQLVPNLPDVVMPAHTFAEVDQAVAHFRTHGFAATLRQMADGLPNQPNDDDCSNWGFACLFWGVADIFICLIPSGWGCLLGYVLTQWLCYMWSQCQP